MISTARPLFCFDLDGTLTRAEILPAIAAAVGLQAEINELTRQTIAGDVDFEHSFRARCQILAHARLPLVHEVIAALPLAEQVIAFIQARPRQCFIVTGNLDIWVAPLAARIGAGLMASRARTHAGRIEVLEVMEKGAAIRHLRAAHGTARIIAVGDGANDVPMFHAADLAIAFGAAHPPAPVARRAAHHTAETAADLCRLLALQT